MRHRQILSERAGAADNPQNRPAGRVVALVDRVGAREAGVVAVDFADDALAD
jgi:hypothetical protein